MFALAFLALAADPLPLPLDTMAVERARSLDGQIVTVTFLVAKPTYTWRSLTVVGADEPGDNSERVAYLKGTRNDIKEGTRITAKGKLRVIDHPGMFIGGVLVPAWTEIRVDEGK